MSLTEAARLRRKWEHLPSLQSVLENKYFSETCRPYSSTRLPSVERVSDLMNIYELLDTYLTENNGTFSGDQFHMKELLIKELQVLSQMFSEAATEFRNAASRVEQLSNL